MVLTESLGKYRNKESIWYSPQPPVLSLLSAVFISDATWARYSLWVFVLHGSMYVLGKNDKHFWHPIYSLLRCFSCLLPFFSFELPSSFGWFLLVLVSKDMMGSETYFLTPPYPVLQSHLFFLAKSTILHSCFVEEFSLPCFPFLNLFLFFCFISRWEDQNCTLY